MDIFNNNKKEEIANICQAIIIFLSLLLSLYIQ